MIPSGAPPAEVDVTVELATSLLSGQHPDLAHLAIGTRFDGWDNVTFRLGDELALRLPRIAAGGALLTRAPGAGMTLDGDALLRHWEAAISAPVDSPPTWIHADLHVRNIVSRGGALGGILDWGDSAAGDPCVDLGQAWQLLPAEAVEDCFAAYGRISDT